MTALTKDKVETASARDPLAEPWQKLFPPPRHRTLANAATAVAKNQFDVAEPLIAGFLEKNPGNPFALSLLAAVARRTKRFDEAEKLLATCVKKSPETPGFRYGYAVALLQVRKYQAALSQIDELLRIDPENPLFLHQKANILSDWGRHEETLACLRKLSEQFPLWPEGWFYLGRALRHAGYQPECIAAWHKALELDPGLTGPYVGLAALKVYRFTPDEISGMEKQLGNPGLSQEARTDMHHALGKAYGDTKDYARSFENYVKANALRRIGVSFDTEKLALHVRTVREVFTQQFFREREGWGCPAPDPIFIIGMPRSGSTLVEQILSSHSAIEGLGELGDIDATLVEPLLEFRDEIRVEEFANGSTVDKIGLSRAWLKLLDRFTGEHFRRIGERYLARTVGRRTTGRPRFTDKALGNFFHLGLIPLALPNAKIIDARRHPLDCGWSCFTSQFPGTNFALRLADIGAQYAGYVRLTAHFDAVLPGRIHRVIHEDLIDNPETELRRLFDYLGLPFEEQCMRFHETERRVVTQSSEQVRQPLNRSGVGQWLPYEPWLGPLKAALGPLLDAYPRVPE